MGGESTLTGAVTNAGTFTAEENTSIAGNVTNSGTFTNSGTVTGAVANSGIMTNTGSLKGSVVNTGTLTTTADGLAGGVNNSKDLVLTGGTLASAIAGTGTTTIAGAVTSSKTIANAVAVNADATFTNSGTITGAVTNAGTLTSNAEGLTGGVDNSNKLVLTGGTLASAITGDGTTTIEGNVTSDKSIANAVKVNENISFTNSGTITGAVTNAGTLTSNADGLTGGVDNSKDLVLTGGTLGSAITGDGTTTITGNVTSDKSIANAVKVNENISFTNSGTLTGAVTNAGTLTSNADGLTGGVDNSNDLVLTGGTLGSDITGDGTTTITGNVTSDKSIANAVKVNEDVSFTNSGALTGAVTNAGTLTTTAEGLAGSVNNSNNLVLTGGTLASDIAGTGTTTIEGNVTSDKSIANAVKVNEDVSFTNSGTLTGAVTNAGTLTTTAEGLTGGVDNSNDLVLTGGALASAIAGTGTTIIEGNVTSDKSISNDVEVSAGVSFTNSGALTGAVTNYGTLKTTAEGLAGGVDNSNNLELTGGTLGSDIKGTTGTTTIAGNVTSGQNIENTVKVNADSSFTNSGFIYGKVVNSGTMTNTGKLLTSVDNTGTLTSNADGLNGKVTNDNELNLTGGSVYGTIASSDSEINGKLNIVDDTTIASTVTNQNITVAQGKTLTVNTATEYLDATDNVTLSGTLNMSDDEATINKVTAKSFTAAEGSSINLDMKLGTTDESDTVTTTTAATGKIALGSVNMVADGTIAVGTKKIIPIFTNADSSFVITGTVTATTDGYMYNFAQDSTNKGSVSVTKGYAGTLADIVQDKTIRGYEMGNIATYSLLENYTNTEDLGTLTRVTGASSRDFTINGNVHTIDGGERNGITVNSGDSLSLTKITLENFAGDVVNNAGTFTADDLTIIYGSVTNSGEATLNGYIAGTVTNSGTMTNTGAFAGSVVNTGKLTTIADSLLSGIENNKDLVLTSGILGSAITGTGTTTIAGSVTSSQAITNAVAVNAGSSLTLADKATVSGALTNNGTTDVTGSDVVLSSGTSTFAATGTTNITGKLTATTGNLSFAGTDNFVIASGGTLVAQAKNFIDVSTYEAVDTARTAAKLESGASLDLLFNDENPTTYTTDDLKKVRTAYSSDDVSFIDRTLELDASEQLVIKRDEDGSSTSITIGDAEKQIYAKPQVVDQDNNVKDIDVSKVPERYVTVVQKQEGEGQTPTIQEVDDIKVINTSFTTKGFQVKEVTGSEKVTITATDGANITLVGGNSEGETLVKNEDNTNLSTDIVVEENATINVGMSINTQEQKGTINSVTVKGNHALDGNNWKKTDYLYNKLAVDTSEDAQVKVLNACLTVKELTADNGTIYVDPSYLGVYAVENNSTLGSNIYVSTGSVVNIGGTDASELQAIAVEAGLTPTTVSTGFIVDAKESMLNLAGNYTLTKRLVVDYAVDSSGNDPNNDKDYDGNPDADVYFGATSLLVVDGDVTNNGTAALAVSGQSVAVESGAKLYLRNAKPGKTYYIVSGAGDIAVDNAWGNDGAKTTKESTTLYASQLLKYEAILDEAKGSYNISTSSSLDPSKFTSSLAYNSLKEMADKSIVDTESTYGGIKFLSRTTDTTYIGDAQMIPVQNELTDLAGTVGVQHNALRTSDLTADAIGAHLTQVKCESTDLWAVPLRSNMSYTGRTEAINNVTGLVVGYDKGTKDGRFGVAIQGGWGTSHSEGTVSYSQNKNKFAGVSLYGSRKIGAFDLKASLGYTKYGNDVRTTLPAGLGMGSVQTDIDANTWTADVRLEREIVTKGAAITPHAGLRYTRIHTNSYDNYIVSGDSQTQNLVQIPLGVTFAWNMAKKDGWNLKPYVDLSFVPVLGNKDSDGKVRFTGLNNSVNNFATRIIDSTSWGLAAGFTAEKGKFSMGLNYYLQKSSNETNNTVALNLNWKF